MDRAIIHLNITDFAVAVERIQDTSLQQVPLIIASGEAAKTRTLVFDMSEEAYQDGVRKGMRLNLARKYCRQAQIISPRPALYRKAMTALVKRVVHYTPLVEPGEEDGHLFMDVTGTHRLFGPAPDIAWRLRKQLLHDLGLDPVWSLASNKLVSKVASRMVRPFGEYIVGVGEENAFLAPLPLSMLPGLKAEEMQILKDFNLQRIGQLAKLSRKQLLVPFQKRGAYLYDASRGRDRTAVVPGQTENKQIAGEHVFEEDSGTYCEVQSALTTLVHGIGRRLRCRGLLGQRMGICLTYGDGKRTYRQATKKGGSDNDFLLRSMALTVLDRAWSRRIRVRSCALICDRLVSRSRQQTLFVMQNHREQQQEKLMAAMDEVCSRFGDRSIRLGAAF
jgi:DNA polymerase IV